VSRFLAGKGYVSSDTRVRIQEAIDALGYRPNRIARSMHLTRTDIIGVLTAGDPTYGAGQTFAGVSASAHAADVTLITTHLERGEGFLAAEGRRAIERMLSMQVDAIIVTARVEGLDEMLSEVVRGEVPVVVVAGRPRARTDTVLVDSFAAGTVVMSHLIETGHERIVYLAGPEDSDESLERERAYHHVMTAAGLPALPPIVAGDWTSDAGHRAGMAADHRRFTAVFAGNDELALGFMAAARAKGLVAPDDFSIVGIDDMPEARYFAPPLTTARLDFVALGRAAFAMAQAEVTDGRGQPRVLISPELVLRSSTGAPRRP
jgi:DNA-binding LacI/PurR family transcriptional regulator